MMRYEFTKALLSIVMLVVLSSQAVATEIIHYSNIPLTIELRQGEERTIQFGDHVQVGITKAQQLNKLFRVQSAQGAVHFLPYKEFDKQRIQIKRLTDSRVILLDLIATKADTHAEPLEDIRIYLESENVIEEEAIEQVESHPQFAVVTPVELTRYAAQRLYGPSRLHVGVPGINESPLGVKGTVRIFKGGNKYKTASTPILAYQGGSYYLAAMHIKNISEGDITLNYLDLNLPFSFATFQHHKLSPHGSPGDSTVVYLVFERPLKEVLYPWTYYHDVNAEMKAAKLAAEKKKKPKRRRRK